MNRIRKTITILILIIMSISLYSCKQSTKEVTTNDKSILKGKVTIWAANRDVALLNEEAQLFKKKNPQVDINIVTSDINAAEDNLSKNLKDKSKLPDMITLEDNDIPSIVDKFKDNLLDADSTSGFKSSGYDKYQIHNSTYSGKIYAFPWYVDPVFMLYREDLLEGINVKSEDIKYWNQYINIGAGPVKAAGKGMLSLDYFNNSVLYDIGLNQLGINYFDSSNNLDLENSIKPAQLLFDSYSNKILYDDSKIGGKLDAFANGDTLSLVCDLATLYNIQNKYPGLTGKLNVEKLPAFEPGGNRDAVEFGENIMALKNASQNKAAMEFIKYVTTDDESSSLEFEKYGYITANISAYSNIKLYKTSSFYKNKSLGRIAIDQVNGLQNIKYNKYFTQIRDTIQSTIIDTSAANGDLKQNIYNVQNGFETSNTMK
ncbi:ABC transporter substrate-binding protein [Clostridium akagii]|uniref:ABC transporter substrate-binding protein n=1 Tax=Clostridium akagii TaxID=91623 RepID=UPI0006912855|nr:ABC transporter substrate-binding protein [Clostridium akagii]